MTTNPLSPTSDMDDFRTRTSDADNTLFGETLTRHTAVNLAIGGLTSLFVLLFHCPLCFNVDEWQHIDVCTHCQSCVNPAFVGVTVISSFVFPTPPPTALNIFFVVCIIMICSSALVLIFWYRQGDLDPKFRGLIYYSIGLIILLCLCANLYFHDVGR